MAAGIVPPPPPPRAFSVHRLCRQRLFLPHLFSSSYNSSLRDSSNCSDLGRWYSSSGSESQEGGTTMPAAGYHVGVGPSYMRGAVFWEKNKPLTFEDFQMPRPKANEVLIKTKGFN